MRIHLIAAGTRMENWVQEGYEAYKKRLTQDVQINLVEIAIEKRRKNADMNKLLNKESDRMLAAIPASSLVIALDVVGESWSTAVLSQRLANWQQMGSDVALLIGGPEGLSDLCKQRARLSWSLSPLTLPHPLVRVIVAEQLYRAWSILNNHPYHRP